MTIERVDPRSDSYSALLWDVVTNAHRYTPRPGDKVLDLGAHYGMFSLYAAARGAEVVAYEPQDIPFRELVHTSEVAAEIGYGQIFPTKMAVWSDHTALQLRIPMGKESTATATAVGDSGFRVTEVTAVPLDFALREQPVWDCVKMDIEGAELEVLRACKDFHKIGYLTVEVHNDILGRENADELADLLHAKFQKLSRLPNKNNPHETVAWFCRR